jgi:two-component SAPR family response regulator
MLAVGILKNTENAVAFIDVEVELSFISEAKTVVDKITIILFNYYEPNTESVFSINIEDFPKATLGYSAKIIGAEGIIN